MAVASPLPTEAEKDGMKAVLTCRPCNYRVYAFFIGLLIFPYCFFIKWIQYDRLSASHRQIFLEHLFWPMLCFDLVLVLVLTGRIIWRYPLLIQLYPDGSLVIVRYFNKITFEGIESAQANPKICWMKKFRRIKADFGTSIRNRVIIKLASGTEVIVAPDNVDAFLIAIHEVVGLQNTV